MRIAVSIGHGLNDPGAVNGEYIEHLHAYMIAWHLKELIDGHEFISCFQHLAGKIKSINSLHSTKPLDLAVEIHFNSSTDTKANGTETLYYSTKNRPLAERISLSIASSIGLRNRGAIKRTNLGFLKQTNCPALIIEVLFLSSPVDTSAIDITFHRRVAEAIAGALT